MAEVTRQEQPTTDNADRTTEQVNPNHIEMLEKELLQFLEPGGAMLITDPMREDIDFLKSAQHLTRLRSIQSTYMYLEESIALTKALLELILKKAIARKQELQEKETYLLKSTEQSTSPPSTTSTKPNESMNKSKSVSESPSPTIPSTSASEAIRKMTKKS
jgi:hypothetical protein